MPITIVATPGATNANAFVSAAEMTAYCEARLNAAIWTAADAQLPALVEATRDLDALEYIGSRATSAQALSWPREWAINPDIPSPLLVADDERYYGTDVVPQRVKDATCELALQYLIAGTRDLASVDTNAGVIEKTVDVLTTKWASGTARPTGLGRYPRVIQRLRPLLAAVGAPTLERA